jgi:hypothetical protein
MGSQCDLENVVGDSFGDAVRPVGYFQQRSDHKPSAYGWRSLIERYINRELALYLVSSEWPFCGAPQEATPEYGVLLYYPLPKDFDHFSGEALGDRRERDIKGVQERAHDMQRAVLVGVREFTHMPERTLDALPCAKGLLRLDQINRIGSDVVEELANATGVETSLRLENGELVLVGSRRISGIQNNQLPNDMIQGRSHVVNDFAYANAPHRIGRFVDLDGDSQFLGCPVEIDCRRVRLASSGEERFHVGFKHIDLLPCSREFQSDS